MRVHSPVKPRLWVLALGVAVLFSAPLQAHAGTEGLQRNSVAPVFTPALAAMPAATLPLPAAATPFGNNISTKGLVLSDSDAAIYGKIFEAYAKGQRHEAEQLAKKLSDKSLIDWAAVRKNAQADTLWLPQMPGQTARVYHSNAVRDALAKQMAENARLGVTLHLKTDARAEALGVVAHALDTGAIDRVEGAQLRARIADSYLHAGQYENALKHARLALQIGGTVVPEAAWVAGLASWAGHDYRRAAYYFSWVPNSAYAGPWLRSAGAYWTARALMRAGDYKSISAWLQVAARNPHSFYGLIATRALGTRFDFDWTVPALSQAHLDTLKAYPGAVRALKLAQAGQMDMARLELALLDEAAASTWREALSALAVHTLKPAAAMKVAGILQTPNGGSIDMALYPVAPWTPEDGYRLDPALIHAFVRQESGFKPEATNKNSGATGLLQLLPRTARALDARADKTRLKKPESSMAVGQKYLEELLERTDGDLFLSAIAYNAGPGNLAEWQKRYNTAQDPLLFIELIPFRETRAYVERVMANYWIYSLRMGAGMGGGVTSLDAVAAGQPPRYATYQTRQAPRAGQVYASISSNTP